MCNERKVEWKERRHTTRGVARDMAKTSTFRTFHTWFSLKMVKFAIFLTKTTPRAHMRSPWRIIISNLWENHKWCTMNKNRIHKSLSKSSRFSERKTTPGARSLEHNEMERGQRRRRWWIEEGPTVVLTLLVVKMRSKMIAETNRSPNHFDPPTKIKKRWTSKIGFRHQINPKGIGNLWDDHKWCAIRGNRRYISLCTSHYSQKTIPCVSLVLSLEKGPIREFLNIKRPREPIGGLFCSGSRAWQRNGEGQRGHRWWKKAGSMVGFFGFTLFFFSFGFTLLEDKTRHMTTARTKENSECFAPKKVNGKARVSSSDQPEV